MLELKGIKKHYPAGNGVVEALKGIDLRTCDIEGISIDPAALRGAIVTPEQALMLAALLGLTIKPSEP